MHKKRNIILLLFIFFYSCQTSELKYNSEKKLNKPIETTPLNFIGQWLNEGLREDLVRNFAREYEFKNQNIKVNLKFPEEVYFDRANVNSEADFLLEQFQKEKSDWDILRINDEYENIAERFGDANWPSKYLVDFSNYPAYNMNTMPELISDKTKNRWQGIIPGPFLEGQFYALWVNTKVAKEIGIDVKQFGMTYDDFLSYVKAAYAYNQENDNKYVTLHESVNWPTAFNICAQLYISKINDDRVYFDSKMTNKKLEAWHETLLAMEELSKYDILSTSCKTKLWDESKFDLIDEKCLFYSNGPWMYNIWLKKNKENTFNCMPTEYPVFNAVTTYPASYQIMWAVPKNSPNKDEAVKFLLELNSANTAEMWVRYTKCPTGIKGNLTKATFGADPFENFSSHIQRTYGNNIYRVREDTEVLFGKDYANLDSYYKEVMLGEMSADEAFNRLLSKINEIQEGPHF